MSPQRRHLISLLNEAGAVLISTKKHKVYKLRNGQIFVQSGPPSDRRAEANQLCLLRRMLRGRAA
jgi:hypothetical protein